jgi:hypothetical protein
MKHVEKHKMKVKFHSSKLGSSSHHRPLMLHVYFLAHIYVHSKRKIMCVFGCSLLAFVCAPLLICVCVWLVSCMCLDFFCVCSIFLLSAFNFFFVYEFRLFFVFFQFSLCVCSTCLLYVFGLTKLYVFNFPCVCLYDYFVCVTFVSCVFWNLFFLFDSSFVCIFNSSLWVFLVSFQLLYVCFLCAIGSFMYVLFVCNWFWTMCAIDFSMLVNNSFVCNLTFLGVINSFIYVFLLYIRLNFVCNWFLFLVQLAVLCVHLVHLC